MVESLRQSLEADDEFLQIAFADQAPSSPGDIHQRLGRMQECFLSLRSQSSSAPSEERPSLAQECSHYEQRLAHHRAQAQESSRRKLLGNLVREAPKKRQASSQEEVEHEETRALAQGLEQLRGTQSFMTEVGSELSKSSAGISIIKDRYSTYADVLDSASKVLGQLKTKTESDSTYIWWSFCFFMSVVTYIVLRRMKVFKIIFFGANSTWWVGSTFGGWLRDIVESIVSLMDRLDFGGWVRDIVALLM